MSSIRIAANLIPLTEVAGWGHTQLVYVNGGPQNEIEVQSPALGGSWAFLAPRSHTGSTNGQEHTPNYNVEDKYFYIDLDLGGRSAEDVWALFEDVNAQFVVQSPQIGYTLFTNSNSYANTVLYAIGFDLYDYASSLTKGFILDLPGRVTNVLWEDQNAISLKLVGTTGDDKLRGGTKADIFAGGGGADRLEGHEGNDILTGDIVNAGWNGEPGNVTQDDAADFLSGGEGEDTFIVAYGDGYKGDVLSGGADRDTFLIDLGDPTVSSDDLPPYKPDKEAPLVIFGGQGADEYRISNGSARIAFLFDPSVKEADLANIDVSKITIENVYGEQDPNVGGRYHDLPDIIIINPEQQDKLFFNGIQVAGATYGPVDHPASSPGYGFDANQLQYHAFYLENYYKYNSLFVYDSRDYILTNGGDLVIYHQLMMDGFRNGDVGAALTGNGPRFDGGGENLIPDGWYTAPRINFDIKQWTKPVDPNAPKATDYDDTITGSNDADNIDARGGNDTVLAGDGNDTIDGGYGNDDLKGEGGNDTVRGGQGSDTLGGGVGTDLLVGGGGGDTYVYAGGDGNDVIDDASDNSSDVDVLSFANLNASDVVASTKGFDLVLTMQATGQVINLSSQFYSATDYLGVEKIVFADGSYWDRATIEAMANVNGIFGTSGDEELFGDAADNTIVGLGGVDNLYGAAGDDVLYGDFAGSPPAGGGVESYDFLSGGEGNDVLYGGADADTLDGAQGNDLLVGGSGDDWNAGGLGDDTYVYARGDGNDVIDDENGAVDDSDVLKLTDLNASDLTISSTEKDLILTINSTDEKIVIKDQYLQPDQHWGVEKVEFADGSFWNRAELAKHGWIKGTTGDDLLMGSNASDVFHGGLGDDVIQSLEGGDTFIYASGDGNDTIEDLNGIETDYDVLRFTDLNSGDISLSIDDLNLKVTVIATGEVITVTDQFFDDVEAWGIDFIEFADGTLWNRGDIWTAVATSGGGGVSVARHVPATGNDGVPVGSTDYVKATEGIVYAEGADGDFASPVVRSESASDYIRFDGASDVSLAEIAANTTYGSGDLWFDPEPIGGLV